MKRKRLKVLLDKHIPEFSVRLGGTTSVDITKSGIDKAYGIRKLRDILGIAISDILFIFASEEQNVNLFTFCPSEAKRSEYSAACGGIKRRSRLLIPRGLPRGGFIGDALFLGGNDYPAKEAGVASIEVRDSNETKRVVEGIIATTALGEIVQSNSIYTKV